MIARRTAPAVAAVLAVFALTACEKPAPQITVYSSGRVINVDAERYCFDECLDHYTGDTKSIRVRGDTDISIDVPKRVAKKGWVLQLGDQVVFREPHHESHYRLRIPTVGEKQPITATVVEAGAGTTSQPTGVWKMQLIIQD